MRIANGNANDGGYSLLLAPPDGVVPRDTKLQKSDPTHLGGTEAFAVSVNRFLPVEVPVGSDWTPTGIAAIYATVHHLAGWILVPLGIAALTGLLHRKAKP